jgi:hypothetical protein
MSSNVANPRCRYLHCKLMKLNFQFKYCATHKCEYPICNHSKINSTDFCKLHDSDIVKKYHDSSIKKERELSKKETERAKLRDEMELTRSIALKKKITNDTINMNMKILPLLIDMLQSIEECIPAIESDSASTIVSDTLIVSDIRELMYIFRDVYD